MGIVNVTPDSFSDGGRYLDHAAAIAHGLKLSADGADILDIGGESTRPGADVVSPDEELRRVVPVVEALVKQSATPISVDTSKAEVARRCLEAGALIVNDVTALAGDPAMLATAREHQAGVVLMHMRGTPRNMQQSPHYDDVMADITRFFMERSAAVTRQGIDAARIALDPGIGFGKTGPHNMEILARLSEFQRLGRPVCLGVSRKAFIGKILERPPGERLPGSLAAVLFAQANKAVQIVRAHDVRETRDAVSLFAAIQERSLS
ncbi:MAG: dihydropteroate synthase [Planctomycetes bacterium]|nr:dihydropteroate synthase [Planctomycetota bacterium]